MIRRLLVATALFIAASATAVTAASAPAQAFGACLKGYECGYLFYSDPGHTNLVGIHTTNCDGTLYTWGVQQGYSVFVNQPCGGTQPPPVL